MSMLSSEIKWNRLANLFTATRPALRQIAMPVRWRLGVLPVILIGLFAACTTGEPAADFALTTFGGDEFRLSEQRGSAVVVNFWYPSCPPCRDEMPAFQEVWEQYRGRNVRVIGLFVPQGFDTEGSAREFVDELGLTFTFATDVRALVAQEYAVEYFPTTYFINRAGRVHSMEISRMDVESLTEILDDLLG